MSYNYVLSPVGHQRAYNYTQKGSYSLYKDLAFTNQPKEPDLTNR